MSKRVYVAPGPGREDIQSMLQSAGFKIITDEMPTTSEVGMVVLCGGTDVHPYTYFHDEERGSRYNFERDCREIRMIRACSLSGIPVVGICRGSQLLCVANGGELYQDVRGHGVNHLAKGYNKNGDLVTLEINSTHHQVSRPDPDKSVMLLWGSNGTRHSNFNRLGLLEVVTDTVENYGTPEQQDAEVVWYPEHNQLGIQYHPEWMESGSVGRELAISLIDQVYNRCTPYITI